MTGGNFLVILTASAAVATILGLFGVRIEGRSAFARVWAWLMRSRNEREALVQRITTLRR